MMINAKILFCCCAIKPDQSSDVFSYLAKRNSNKDRDKYEPYLKALNNLNIKHKFWVRYVTGSPIEITEITDEIAKATMDKLGIEASSVEAKPDNSSLYSGITDAVYNLSDNISGWLFGDNKSGGKNESSADKK